MTGYGEAKTLPQIYSGSLVGWKLTHGYVRADNGELRFRALNGRGITHAVEDKAYCAHFEHWREPSPYVHCLCGFNAWADVPTAMRAVDGVLKYYKERLDMYKGTPFAELPPAWVMQRVDLHGRVIEGTVEAGDVSSYGYRAEYQTVRDVFIPPDCDRCIKPADHLASVSIESFMVSLYNRDSVDHHRLRPLCDDHVDIAYRVFDLHELADRNNVGVHWGYPDPAPE